MPEAGLATAEAAPSARARLVTVLGVVLVTALIVAAVVLIQGLPQADQAAAEEPVGPKVGATAPDFKAFDLDGNPVQLQDLRGEPVWLLIQTTWCSSCRAELPDIEAVSDRITVISVFMKEDRDTVAGYADRIGLELRSIPDPIGEITLQYLTTSVPTHFFIDADGTIDAIAKGILLPAEIEEHLSALGV